MSDLHQNDQTKNKPVLEIKRVIQAPAMFQPKTIPVRRRVSGRLISLSHYTDAVADYLIGTSESSEKIVINFPSMPESIELARSANYKVFNSFTLPDGIHQYQHTDPQIIPFSFEVHAMDEEYCPQGALTLLKIAAWLHALLIPIGDSSKSLSGTTAGLSYRGANGVIGPPKTEGAQVAAADSPTGVQFDDGDLASRAGVAFPVACKLELCYVDNTSPGIACVGYVRDVRATLKGPWLKPPGGGRSLPSKIEASFNFVHRPAHTNSFIQSQTSQYVTLNPQAQAYADDVKNKLYNTAELVKNTGNTYTGFRTKTN